MNLIRKFFFKKAVRNWCVDIRLLRELEKELTKIGEEARDPNANQLVMVLNMHKMAIYMPEYRQLSNKLMREHTTRIARKLKLRRSAR